MDLGFGKGDKVNYLGGNNTKEIKGTYIWAVETSTGIIRYVIEHPDGMPKSHFMAKDPFPDGFDAVHSSELKDGMKYIYAIAEKLEHYDDYNE